MHYTISIIFLFTSFIFAQSEYSTTPLHEFIYFTDSERAGGGPFVFNALPSFSNRRDVVWGSVELLNRDWPGGEPICDCSLQTNGALVMSNFSCPTFNNTVTVTQWCHIIVH